MTSSGENIKLTNDVHQISRLKLRGSLKIYQIQLFGMEEGEHYSCTAGKQASTRSSFDPLTLDRTNRIATILLHLISEYSVQIATAPNL
jgi:hypothetical protein